MKEEIKIAIFGLSLNVLDNIKQKIRLIFDDNVEITWATIADPHLDILLVNDMFFGSPTIQSLVGGNTVPYLRLVNKNDKAGVIDGDILYLPFALTEDVRTWFRERYLKVPVSIRPQQQQTAQRVELPRQQKADYKKVLLELLDERNGNVQVFDNRGNISIVNTKTQQVWNDVERRIQGTDASINYTYATMQMTQSVSTIQGLDLRTWIWNLLWYSPSLDQQVSTNTYYRLQYWPQPATKQDRQDIFKIAACFEKGANVTQVEKKLKISRQVIERFVSVSLLSQAMSEISSDQAKLKIDTDETSEKPLRGFFGKLRKRLGL